MRIPTRIRRVADRAAHRLAPDLAVVGWPPELGLARRSRHPSGMVPRVGIVGFYGPGNYGDELFLDTFREHLAPALDLDVVFDAPTRPYFKRPVRDVVREHDAIVIGGGDLVIPWGLGDRYWLTDYLRRPVHVIGVGVPTWRPAKPSVVTALGRFLRHGNVRSISARDEESAAWIREHLRPRVQVEAAADLVFALTLPPVVRPVDPPILGITVRWRAGGDDYSAVRALADRGRALGYRLRTIVLSTGIVRARDEAALLELGLTGDDIEHIASDDLEALSRAIGECTMLASHKFHGSVVATSYGIPAISMSTTDKNRNLMGRLGRPEFVCAFDDQALPDRLARPPAPIDLAVRDAMARDARASLVRLRERVLAD
ncbi:MAG: polysaccharide pyruvyl transferase family protein [Candidatus Limnocylindrales bacterium]